MGRRWGKSVMGGCAALAVASGGGRAAWVVPEYKNGRPLWRFAESAVAPLRMAGLARIDRADRLIEFTNGGALGIYSADNSDSIRGEWFSLVVLDEAAKIAEDAWTDAIQPTLADTDGDALLISTPHGRNWFWREWGVADRDGEYSAAWQAPSSDNPSPRIRRLAERMRDLVPDRSYRQEWLAEFVEDGGGVFRRVREAATLHPLAEGIGGRDYVYGVDWGKHADFTAIAVLDAATREQVALERFNRIDYTLQTGRLRALCGRFPPVVIVAERNSMGEPLLESLTLEGLPIQPFTTTAPSKKKAIEALALALERDALTLLDDPTQTAELEAYEATRLPSGMLRYGAPAGMHDDTVMALALAWHALDATAEIGPADPDVVAALAGFTGR